MQKKYNRFKKLKVKIIKKRKDFLKNGRRKKKKKKRKFHGTAKIQPRGRGL